MAWRCRNCQALMPREVAWMPPPEKVAPLAPFMSILVDIGTEYDSIGEGELTTAVEFLQWLDADVRRANGDPAFRTIVTGMRETA